MFDKLKTNTRKTWDTIKERINKNRKQHDFPNQKCQWNTYHGQKENSERIQ